MSWTASGAALILAPAIAVLLTACGGGSSLPTPTPTPLPTGLLQQRYVAAASAYDAGEVPVAVAENQFCDPPAPAADLTRCASALSGDRQATIVFDNAIRGLRFPHEARGAVSQLLDDDERLETLLRQASTSPSLTAVAALTPQIFELLSATAHDADLVRGVIGLPPASPQPTPTALPAAALLP